MFPSYNKLPEPMIRIPVDADCLKVFKNYIRVHHIKGLG